MFLTVWIDSYCKCRRYCRVIKEPQVSQIEGYFSDVPLLSPEGIFGLLSKKYINLNTVLMHLFFTPKKNVLFCLSRRDDPLRWCAQTFWDSAVQYNCNTDVDCRQYCVGLGRHPLKRLLREVTLFAPWAIFALPLCLDSPVCENTPR